MAGAVRQWFDEAVGGWNRFWFTPTDPATVGLIRILTGGMLFYTHLVWGLALEDFFGPHGWLPKAAVKRAVGESFTWSYLTLVDSPALLWTLHVAALVVFALLTVGLFSRTTSILAFIATASYIGRARGALFGLDQVNSMLAMYLMLAPSGAAYSLDRWLLRRKAGGTLPPAPPTTAGNIAIRLIQVHLCVIYLFAGMGKLMGPAWWDGTAMWKAIANLEYQSLDMTWMADWPRMLNLATHVTIFWELFYCALIWPRFTRPIMLALAVPLHLGIAVCLGMVTFGVAMLIANLAFVSPQLVRACLRRVGLESPAAAPAASSPPARSSTGKARSKAKRSPEAPAL